MQCLTGTASRQESVGLRWHQGDANLHLFLSCPLARKLPNDVNSQKVTESPREGSRFSRNISKFYIKNWKSVKTSVVLCFVLFVLFSTAEAETSCLKLGEKVSSGDRGWCVVGWWSLTLLPVCIYHVLVHYLIPLCTLRRSMYLCSLALPDHFWSIFNKVLVQILASCDGLNVRFKGEADIHLVTVWIIWRRLRVQHMSLTSLSWWYAS